MEQIGRTLGREMVGWGRGTELGLFVLGKHLLGDQLMVVTWALRALESGRGSTAWATCRVEGRGLHGREVSGSSRWAADSILGLSIHSRVDVSFM